LSIITQFYSETITVQLKDGLGISAHNWLAHSDIEQDIQKKKNGLYSFSIRVVNSEITDYMPIENVKYNLAQVS